MIDQAEVKRLADMRAMVQNDIQMVHDVIRENEAVAARLLKASQVIGRELLAAELGGPSAADSHAVARNITHDLKSISTIAFNMKQGGSALSYSTTAEEQFAAIEQLANDALTLLVIQKP